MQANYAMWNVSSSNERPQNTFTKSLNQIPYQGAKTAHSDMRSGIQQASLNSQNMNDSHPGYQDMQKMDSTMRYNSNDGSSHASSGSFHPSNGNNNVYRNMGNLVHSNGNNNNNGNQISSAGANPDAGGPHGQGSFVGAQYGNAAANGRPKNQGTGAGEPSYMGNGNNNSPYSGWPGLNSTSMTSNSNNGGGNSGWIIPNNISSMKIHDNSGGSGAKESLSKDCEENMSVDNEMSYTDLVGATGGSSESGDKQSNNMGRGNVPWGMPSRLGLLGGGESSVNPVSSAWGPNQGIPTTSSSASSWESGRQMAGGVSGESGNGGTDMMVVDNQAGYSSMIGAVGGSDYSDTKAGDANGYKQDSMGMQQQQPPRLGLLGGGESSLNTASSGWGGPGSSTSGNGSSWVGGNPRMSGGPADMSGNSSSGMSPPKPHNSWAQAAGKGLNQNPGPPNNGSTSGTGNGNGRNGVSGPETGNGMTEAGPSGASKSREEIAAEIKVKAAVSEGWGQKPVNQDTPWDIPPSPPAQDIVVMKEPHAATAAPQPPPWRAPVNNGTEIWQNNLRLNKIVSSMANPTTTTAPWGHTPATNIGGHWGEDDEDTSNNTWNASQTQVAGASNWSQPGPSGANAMWGSGPPQVQGEKHWPPGQAEDSFRDVRCMPVEDDDFDMMWINPVVAKHQRNVSWSPAQTPKKDNPTSGWEVPSPPVNVQRQGGPVVGGGGAGGGGGGGGGGNYDDGTAVWGNPQRQGKVSHWKDMPSAKPIMNSATNMGNPSGMPPMSMGGGSMPPNSPGMIRLPSGAAVACKSDMGPGMWNKAPSGNRKPGWQDMPSHDSPNIGTWGDDSLRVPNPMGMSGSSNAGGFGGNWSDQNNSGYGLKPKGSSNWADGQVDTSSWLGPSKQRGDMMQDSIDDMSGNTWPDGSKNSTIGYWNAESANPSAPVTGWVGRKLKGGKPLTRDLIWASKQFRLLIEMGFKKEDVENALRNSNMNCDEALVELRSTASMDSGMVDMDGFHGRKVRPANMSDDISMSDNILDPSFGGSYHANSGFQGGGNFQGMGSFKPQVKVGGPNNLLNAALSGQNSNLGSIGNFNPGLFQKLLPQQPPLQLFAALNNQGNRVGQNSFPSASQLRHLVQQIQMAVHAGHLNPQILNQALAPQTLQLLYQLLQQIKMLHQLQQQQVLQSQHGPKPGPGNASGLQLNVQITQTKQRILNLQNQIAAQQAVFLKQQVPQPHQSLHSSQAPGDIFKPNVEPVPSLQSDFRDLSLKDVPLQAHQQSRLTQWKLSSYDKDESTNLCSQNPGAGSNSSFSNEFSRAPGPLPSKTSSSASSSMPNPGPNLHPLLGQGDSAWSSLSRPQGDSSWPETATSLAGLSDSGAGNGAGGNSALSSIPPGSGANGSNGNNNSGGSSSNSSMENKDSSGTPPNSGPSISSASHTSYSLTDLVPEFEPGKPWKGTQLKNIEDDPHITPGSITRSPLSVNTIKDPDLIWNSKVSPSTTAGSDIASTLASSTWMFTPSNTTVSNSSSGAISKGAGSKSTWNLLSSDPSTDVWGSSGSKPRGPPPGLSSQGWDRQSNFVLLRNLTPQIDGSTLKTLCMQHGPLQLFHLSLNYGIALVRYSTREEASKAQSALNNCVLGNTTILADIPSDSEVQQYLVLLTNQNSTGNMSWPSSQLTGGSSGSSFRSSSGGGNGSSSYPFNTSAGNGTNGSSKLDSSSGWNGSNYNMPSSSQLWNFPNTSSALWGSTQPVQPLGSDHDPSTNAPLNRFLPDDLLGGESM